MTTENETKNKQINKDVSNKKKKKPMTRKKMIIIFAVAVVSIVLLTFLGIFLYHTVFNPVSAFTVDTGNVDENNNNNNNADVKKTNGIIKADNRINILVLGMDIDEERASSSREDFRCDTILLVSVNSTTKKIDMITVPRDSYANVKNATGKFYKINSAVYFGGGVKNSGFMNACDTISTLFGGIDINYYATIEMTGFEKLVDTIGGVNFDVDIDYPKTKVGPELKKGYQKLNGKEVLTYCRVRKKIGTDLDRQGRQFKMILAILKQLKSNDQITKIPDIYKSLQDMIYTNLSFEQICALAVLTKDLDFDKDINRYCLDGEYGKAYGHSMYLIDQSKKVELVKKVFGIDIPEDEEHDLHYVLNHSNPSESSSDDNPDASNQ